MEKSAKKMGLISLAIPILVESVLRSFMGTINISLLGNYSDSAVAAVGVSNQIMNVVIVAFNAITAGTAVLINQYIGAKKEQEANQIGSFPGRGPFTRRCRLPAVDGRLRCDDSRFFPDFGTFPMPWECKGSHVCGDDRQRYQCNRHLSGSEQAL